MSDQTNLNDDLNPGTPLVAAPEGSVSDAPLADQEPVVNDEAVPAQVTGPAPAPVATVPVNEVHVQSDEVYTDPSGPYAVQIPDAGRGNSLPPAARAYTDAQRPEDVFAAVDEPAQHAPNADSDPQPVE